MSEDTTCLLLDSGTTERTYFFMMNCLLYSRMETGFPSNDEYLDEDVNVYLANLLTESVHGGQEQRDGRQIASCDFSLFESLQSDESPREKFRAYKVTADRLIIAIGIYDNPTQNRKNSVPHMAAASRSFIGRGKAYYSLAQSYAVEAQRRQTAIADVLGKMSRGFEKYVAILSQLRSEYFDFRHRISEGELFHLEQALDIVEQEETLKQLYDEFLDLYSEYKKDGAMATRRRVEDICRRIRLIDPSFRFEL